MFLLFCFLADNSARKRVARRVQDARALLRNAYGAKPLASARPHDEPLKGPRTTAEAKTDNK